MKTYFLKSFGITLLIFIDLAVSTFLCCMLIFYGPFPTVRRYIVGTAMSSYSHQYLAKLFLSNQQIADILKTTTYNNITTQKGSGIKFSYGDNSIDEYSIKGAQFKGYMLVIKDPKRVKIGYTSKLTVQGERTSEIAAENNAVAAINGGGFTDKSDSGKVWAGTGAYPTDFLMSGGIVKYKDIPDTKKTYVVALDKQGKLIVGRHSLSDLTDMNVIDALTFNPQTYIPTLVLNGEATFSGDGGAGTTARTAIGQKADGSILLLVLDGRRVSMLGATLHDVQKIMLDYGAYTATCLDGGSSTTMYYNGSVINDPCDPLGERSVATAVYVTP